MKQRIASLVSQHWFLILLLLLLSVGTHFFMFGYPQEIVFDEVYFGDFASQYFRGSFYFDIHPPLGKLLLGGALGITGMSPPLIFDFNHIGDTYPTSFYLAMRGLVSLFGALLPLIIYGLFHLLTKKKSIAVLGGLFIIFENALLIQSRFILIDTFLLVFGFLALYLLLLSYEKRSSLFFYLSILSCGFAFSIKWTGLLFFGLSFLIILYHHKIFPALKKIILFLGGILFIYISIFGIHLALLPYSGEGDAYMTKSFQSTLIGNAKYGSNEVSPSLFEKIYELNTRMLTSNATISPSHPYGSEAYTWPLMMRSIYFWNESFSDNIQARIYLIGNPFIWWGSLVSIIVLSLTTCIGFIRKKSYKKMSLFPLLMVVGFWANLIPFLFISRVMFLYHYFPSLIFAIGAFSYYISHSQYKKILIPLSIALALSLFLFFSPLSYGLPLSEGSFHMRLWLPSWL